MLFETPAAQAARQRSLQLPTSAPEPEPLVEPAPAQPADWLDDPAVAASAGQAQPQADEHFLAPEESVAKPARRRRNKPSEA